MTRGGRLQKALDRWGDGVMAFQERMAAELEGTGVKGATYPAIKRYLDDEAEPAVGFLEVAADVLAVRRPWLAFGDGPMTEEGEEVRSVERQTEDRPELSEGQVEAKVRHYTAIANLVADAAETMAEPIPGPALGPLRALIWGTYLSVGPRGLGVPTSVWEGEKTMEELEGPPMNVGHLVRWIEARFPILTSIRVPYEYPERSAAWLAALSSAYLTDFLPADTDFTDEQEED